MTYSLRLIEDRNNNFEWDSGNYLAAFTTGKNLHLQWRNKYSRQLGCRCEYED
jgi:hypothetical protein